MSQAPSTDVVTPTSQQPLELVLRVVEGPDFGRELVLKAGTYVVGKDPTSDLALTDSAVSRAHLRVEVRANGVRLKDAGSTNGSFCGGMRFDAVEVGPGASVRVGRSVLKVLPAGTQRPALKPSERAQFGPLVGRSLAMRETFALLERLAATGAHVLIEGETGTGKDLCAQALHEQSGRKGPFVVCDLASVSPSLIESELFGHQKGAFTGATADRAGAFERADGGTIFLDEVGELPLEIQPRLLRALERMEVKRVGGDTYRAVDVRIISATHRDLERACKEGRFREDLFHRLVVTRVSLPPLRERLEDIPLLVDQMLSQLSREPAQLDPQTRAMLADYAWPGNLRELRNVVARAVALGGEAALPPGVAGPPRVSREEANALPFKEAKEKMVESFERDYLAQLLTRCDWNISQASRDAGIARFYLRQLLTKHHLKKP